MKSKYLTVATAFVGLLLLFAIAWFIQLNQINSEVTPAVTSMTESEARIIAEASCIKGGAALDAGTYDAKTKTWVYDANTNARQADCSSYCVVNEITKTAEMQSRCIDIVSTTSAKVAISLSVDKKLIVQGNKVLLSIDDDTIFNFFKTKSQICNEYNITTTPDRKMFCEDKVTFKKETRFKSIEVARDEKKVGFTLESDTLSPDTVVGIFYPHSTKNKVIFLSGYYLGNEFLSFSPTGINFVYRGGCWEAICAFYIKDSETLQDKINFIPKEADARGNYEFVRWVSDSEIEYKLYSVVHKASLLTVEKTGDGATVGYVTGQITIGPFCPVEREGQVCTVPSEAYTSRSVIVYSSDGNTIMKKAVLDYKRKYTITLNPGTYFLQIQPAGIGPGEKKKVVVISFKTTVVDFDIDTGIR